MQVAEVVAAMVHRNLQGLYRQYFPMLMQQQRFVYNAIKKIYGHVVHRSSL
jgi:hypothetical protein